MLLQYSREEITFLGKLLIKHRPHIAEELLSNHRPEEPRDTDLKNIPFYFLTFCAINQLSSDQLAFARYDSSLMPFKREFIAVLLKIYSPASLKPKNKHIKYGIVKRTAAILNNKTSYISELIDEIITHYDRYDDFRHRVDKSFGQMKREAA